MDAITKALREAIIRSLGGVDGDQLQTREELLETVDDILDQLTVDGIIRWGGEGAIILTERGEANLEAIKLRSAS